MKERKEIMKTWSKSILYFSLCALFFSCAQDELGLNDSSEAATDATENGIVCTVRPLAIDVDASEDNQTRSTLSLGNGVMDFKWQSGEKITVYSNQQNKGDFTLDSLNKANPLRAYFSGGGFSLTEGQTYYTLSKSKSSYKTLLSGATDSTWAYNIPFIPTNGYADFNADNWTNIKMTYDGQRMPKNACTDSLGLYDYMTARANATSQNSAHFTFEHLGLTLRLVIKGLPTDVAFSKLTMYDASDNSFRELARTTNITNTNKDSANYAPYFDPSELTDVSERFSTMLGVQDADGNEQGIYAKDASNDGSTANNRLIVYMQIPPIDLTGRTIAFRLTPVSDTQTPYFCTYKGRTFRAGTAVQMTMTAQQCTEYNINVKVIQDWSKGNVVEQTRATGDPGKTVTLSSPKYLYAFFVNGGKLVARAYAEDIAESNWTSANNIFSYTGSWTTTDGSKTETKTSLTLDATNGSTPRVYMIASSTAITSWKDADGTDVTFAYGSSSGTAESVIQSLTYDYVDQSQMLNLYSTAFVDNSSFAGTLGDDVKDVRLYHVASKVDINWESASALSGNVSINNIPTTNLSFFQPTTNAAASETTVSPSTALTTGTAYYGRTSFYVPQTSTGTYNVTIGSKTQDITFTPDATYTSWFRGLITVK